MSSQSSFSQGQMDLLMRMASQRMGTDPQKLRTQIEGGDLGGIMQSLSPSQQAQLSHLMNNPAAIEQIIASPKVQQLLKGLMGK